MSLRAFLFVYILGGLTFIPLIIGAVVLHAYLTFPTRVSDETEEELVEKRPSDLERPNDDPLSFKTGTDALAEKFHRKHEADVAAGYFAVCREYVPGGVNGKPPERTTPAGEVVATESPSVYQSMYRSIFDRNQKPTIEPAKNGAKNSKKPRNVFFVVLRHGHLMLYDDAEQIEVRHVISLEYHDVSLYSGGDEIPEGELYIKRNSICLTRKQPAKGDMGVTSLPFYLFSESQSEKEDFYFAILRNQQKMIDSPDKPPEPLQFEAKDIILLVQNLHSSQEHLETRWLNALIGRLFLAMYKTPQFESFVRKKIVKKISRVKKPTFITKIVLQKIELGDSGPFILNPRLRDLTVNGDCMVEADVRYSGKFRLEVGATARIDLGRRFGAREVDLVLAVVVRKVDGHMLLKFKPPPSNRVWFTFETMPNIEMTIEPIVSTRQITYSMILRTIESRIREVIAESLVLPFWDDIPFMETFKQQYRGGIWKQDNEVETKHEEIKDEDPEDEAEAGPEGLDISNLKHLDERTMSMPTIPASLPGLKLRGIKSSKSLAVNESASASATGLDKSGGVQLPRSIRSNSFATPADPKVTTNNANADSGQHESQNTPKKDAAAAMKELSDRSPQMSPTVTPFESPANGSVFPPEMERKDSTSSKTSIEAESIVKPRSVSSTSANASQVSIETNQVPSKPEPEPGFTPKRSTTLSSFTSSLGNSNGGEKQRQALPTISAATAAARKWGLGMMNRNEGRGNEGPRPGTPDHPMGRGRPLPPPGVPLPPPERSSRSNSIIPKRKPVPPPLLPERKKPSSDHVTPEKPPLPDRRKQRGSSQLIDSEASDEVFVVEAPTESAPTTPSEEVKGEFFAPVKDQTDTDEGATQEQGPKEVSRKPVPPPLPFRDLHQDAVEVIDGETRDVIGQVAEAPAVTEAHESA